MWQNLSVINRYTIETYTVYDSVILVAKFESFNVNSAILIEYYSDAVA